MHREALSQEEEQCPVIACLLRSRDCRALSEQDLRDLAECMFKVKLKRNWAAGFLKRHSDEIKLDVPRTLSPIRSRNTVVSETEHFT